MSIISNLRCYGLKAPRLWKRNLAIRLMDWIREWGQIDTDLCDGCLELADNWDSEGIPLRDEYYTELVNAWCMKPGPKHEG